MTKTKVSMTQQLEQSRIVWQSKNRRKKTLHDIESHPVCNGTSYIMIAGQRLCRNDTEDTFFLSSHNFLGVLLAQP